MVSGDLEALTDFSARAKRARLLADRFPAAREALEFVAQICAFQQTVKPESPADSRDALIELVRRSGPPPLKEEAGRLDQASGEKAMEDYLARRDLASHRSFFARVLLQPRLSATSTRAPSLKPPSGAPRSCPRCGHPPQVGCLRPESHGSELSLICSLCLGEWPFPRGVCPGCGVADDKKLAYYSATEISHIRVQVCESCRTYIHAVDLGKDAEAIPDVDEIAALPLDVWANERDCRKIQPSLVGI